MEETMKEDIQSLIECIRELSDHAEVDMVWLESMAEKYKID
ncbi:MAG: hypothetical protein N4A54_04075 [Peptostreptococcaceae bacterium]|jgi:hypothetical protein|nr:hypothetical protein [Peptostreptococcaceae bacterium]